MVQATEDQVVLVTGSTDGLGKRVAQDLADRGATVLLHGRNPEKGKATLDELQSATGNPKLTYYNADLASLDAVRQLAGALRAEQPRLDILINNAGIGAGARPDRRQLSRDGYELRFAVNYLAHFLLTHRLLPLLLRSAPARIINVASIGQEPINFGDIMLEQEYNGLRAYRQSKLMQIMFTFDLAEKLRDSGVTVNCLHPASLMDTNMVRKSDYFGGPMSSVEEGARAVEYLATSPELDGVTGKYFEGQRRAHADEQAYNEDARRRLRTWTEQLAGLEDSDE